MADIIQKLIGIDVSAWIAAIVAFLTGVIAISLLIPGEQPEKALQGIVDFLKKLSIK